MRKIHLVVTMAALALSHGAAVAQTAQPAPPAAASPAPRPAPAAGQISDDDIQKLFADWDANDDDVIRLAEWLRAGRQETGFRQVDTDRNEAVSLQELRTAIARMQSGG